MARRIGPAKRTVEFAHAIAQHPMLINAIRRCIADTLPELVALIEAEERQAAAPPAAEPSPFPTYRERLALRNGPPPRG